MNKAQNLLIALCLISFSFELDCSSLYSIDDCSTYNTLNKLQCHQFKADDKCAEVIVDDGCEINSSHQCTKTDQNSNKYECYFSDPDTNKICRRINLDTGCKAKIPTSASFLGCERNTTGIEENQDCFLSEDKKTCQKKTKSCELYSDSDCGGLKGTKKDKQCYYYEKDGKCHEVTLDNNCEYSETTKMCSKLNRISDEDFDPVNYKCDFNDQNTVCQKRKKECSEYDIEQCNKCGNTCKKTKKGCSIVTIDSKCEINSDGECVDKSNGGIEAYEKCKFNDLYTKCSPENLKCNEITDVAKCSSNKVAKKGYECKNIEGKENCDYVQIDNECKIDNDGKCKIKTTQNGNNNECRFKDEKTKCIYYQVHSECSLDDSLGCKDGAVSNNTKKCDFTNTDKTICELRDKKCSEYTVSDCEGIVLGTKKCSLKGTTCEEFTIDSYCTVNAGSCEKNTNANNQFNENEACLFDLEETNCSKKKKECTSYYKDEDCKKYDINTEQQKTNCVRLGEQNHCKQITIDNYCHVSESRCVPVSVSELEKTETCAFDSESNPTSCKKRNKTCREYGTDDSCNSLENCAYINYNRGAQCNELEVDSNCEVSSDGDCIKKEGSDIDDNSKCAFFDDVTSKKIKCGKINKPCEDYHDETKCNSAPKGGNYQCRFSREFSSCLNITIDNYCQVDEDDNECVKKANTNFGNNYICAFNADKSSCLRREAKCDDFTNENCGSLVPESKTCVYSSSGSSGCHNVQIDNKCYIENNECKGNSCSFDDVTQKNKCVYKENTQKNNNSAFVKLNQIMILILLFML